METEGGLAGGVFCCCCFLGMEGGGWEGGKGVLRGSSMTVERIGGGLWGWRGGRGSKVVLEVRVGRKNGRVELISSKP